MISIFQEINRTGLFIVTYFSFERFLTGVEISVKQVLGSGIDLDSALISHHRSKRLNCSVRESSLLMKMSFLYNACLRKSIALNCSFESNVLFYYYR